MCAHASYLALLKARAAGLEVIFTWLPYGVEKWEALAAVVESLVSGTPVLISNKVNIWREIKEDVAGLVEPDDVGGTMRMLERWLVADNAAIRAAAARCFTTRFDIRSTAANLAAIVCKYC